MFGKTFALILGFLWIASAACPSYQGTLVSSLPSSLTELVVPANAVYVYDLESSYNFTRVVITGTLVFQDTKDLHIGTNYILVNRGGSLIAGSCDCPFTHNLVFEMVGGPSSQSVEPFGTKVIAVDGGGTIELYGKLDGPSWTVLGATANVNDTSIVLSENVNWKVGDKIVIATTDYWDNQNEERTITAVTGNTVSFTQPLAYMHYGEIYKGVDMRAEVGLLNRRILITGDNSSEANMFGAHTMFLEDSVVRLSGVELTRAGQFGVLGKYPVHFHVAKDVQIGEGVVVDCSIHHSYQRCVTVHDTYNLLIKRNVCYKTNGHAFFLEVATEHGNTFAWNLGISPKPVQQKTQPVTNNNPPLASDNQPAVFWITNPNNTFIHNHAVGGAFGYWLAFPHWDLINPTPSVDIATKSVIPRRVPLAKFAHNIAHSSSADCMHVDNGPNPENFQQTGLTNQAIIIGGKSVGTVGQNYDPQSDPYIDALVNDTRKAANKPVWVNFEDTTFYKCANHGAWLRTLRTNFTGLYVSDVARGLTSATGYATVIRNGVFVGFSPNVAVKSPPWSQVWSSTLNKLVPSDWAPRGFEFYDGPNQLDNIRLYDLKDTPTQYASGMGVLDHDVFGIGYGADDDPYKGNWMKRTVIDDPTTILFAFPWNASIPLEDGEKQFFAWDMDGYYTSRPPAADGTKATFIANEPFFNSPNCISQDVKSRALICPSQFFTASFTINGLLDDWSKPGFLRLIRADDPTKDMWYCGMGDACADAKRSIMQKNYFNVVLYQRTEQYVHYEHNAPLGISFSFGAQLAGETPVISVCLPRGANNVNINGFNKTNSRDEMLAQPYSTAWAKFGAFWYDSTNGYIHVRVNLRNSWIGETITWLGGSGKGNWCPTPVSAVSDTRTLPPVQSLPPLPALTIPISQEFPRDSSDVCGDFQTAPNAIAFRGQTMETWIFVKPSQTGDSYDFTIKAKHSGMVAIGFPSVPGQMTMTDAIIGWAGPTPTINDYYIGGSRSTTCPGGVCVDASKNIEKTSVTEEGGVTTMKFTRRKIAQEPNDHSLAEPGNIQPILIALSDGYALGYHNDVKTSLDLEMPTLPKSYQLVNTPAAMSGGASAGIAIAVIIILAAIGVGVFFFVKKRREENF